MVLVDQNSQRPLQNLMRGIVTRDDTFNTDLSVQEITLESVSKHLVQWLLDGTPDSTLEIAGILRSSKMCQILDHALDRDTFKAFRIMIYLASVFFTNDTSIDFPEAVAEKEITATPHTISHYAGYLVLKALDTKLRPARLEASRKKLDELRAMFLVTFTLLLTARYYFLQVRVSITSAMFHADTSRSPSLPGARMPYMTSKKELTRSSAFPITTWCTLLELLA